MFFEGWLGDLDPMAQHGGCDVLKGNKWVANLWLTLVGERGTGDAFKGWIDYGKDESKFKPGTNWKGEAVKTGTEEEKESKDQGENSKDDNSEEKQEDETETEKDGDITEEKERTIEEAKQKRGDGSYDVKLEL